jgi:hypothetical protein
MKKHSPVQRQRTDDGDRCNCTGLQENQLRSANRKGSGDLQLVARSLSLFS